MTDIPIQTLVKCPMLFEHEPNDLAPVNDCLDCKYSRWGMNRRVVNCKWGEE